MKVELQGVPETLLWNLYHRAAEARRPDSLLQDPRAVELVDTIDFPFLDRFGPAGFGQWQALRALRFDAAVRAFLARHPHGSVVALGEGLETQFWRVDNGTVRWLTVELPEIVALRRALLPCDGPRLSLFGCSALDPSWMDHADPSRGLLLTAQGLLMYFQPSEVHLLIAACAGRFPGASLILDGVPPWFSRRTLGGGIQTSQGYRTPPMPWGLDSAEMRVLRQLHPRILDVRRLPPARGRGFFFGALAPLLQRTPGLRNLPFAGLPAVEIRFRPA